MLYSDLINKTVIDVGTMKKLGEVDGVYLSKTFSISHYSTNNGYYVPIESVNAINDVITVQLTATDIESVEPIGIRLPDIGGEIIDTCGKLLGRIDNYSFTKDDRMKGIITGDTTILSARVIKYGAENILIKGKNRSKIATNSINADRLALSPINQSDSPLDSINYDANGFITPKIIGNYDFLIGRRLIKDIVKNGTVIAKRDLIIDSECVKNMSEAGKLVELAIYSDR